MSPFLTSWSGRRTDVEGSIQCSIFSESAFFPSWVDERSLVIEIEKCCGSLHTPTETQLFLTPKKKSGAGEWPKLFRENNSKKQGCVVVSPCFCPKVGKFSRGATPPNAPSTAHGARSAAATELRRSRCCDGYAQTSSVALILRVASS